MTEDNNSEGILDILKAHAHAAKLSLHDFVDQLLRQQPTTQDSQIDYKTFVESSPALMCILDFELRFYDVNPAISRLIGQDSAALKGQALCDFVHPDDHSTTQHILTELISSGQQTAQLENRLRDQHGHYKDLMWSLSSDGRGLIYATGQNITAQKIAEHEIKASANEVRWILESIDEGFFAVDSEDRFTYINRAALQLMENPRSEYIGKKAHEVFPEEVYSLFFTDPDRSHKHTQYCTHHQRWFRTHQARLDNGGLAVFFYDVTSFQELETQLQERSQALHASRERLRGILDSQHDLVCRYAPDTSLTYVNDAYCAYFQVSREDLLGNSFLPYAVPEEHGGIHTRIAEIMQDPAPKTAIVQSMDGDGERRWIQWVDHGIVNENGEVTEVQAVGRDITEFKRHEEALNIQTELLQTVIDNIPIMIGVFNPQGRFILVNREWQQVLGWTNEEMNAHPDIMTAFYPDPADRQVALEYMLSAQPGWRDFKTHSKEGRVVDTTWANVRLSDGRSIGIGKDIGERKRMEAEQDNLRQLEAELNTERELIELKQRFISIMSHEFRTPLAVLSSSIELILRYEERLPKERIIEKVANLNAPITQMLAMLDDLPHINMGGPRLKTSEFGLKDFLNDIVHSASLIHHRSHRFHVSVTPAEGQIQADRRLLEHVFVNLIGNAIKFSASDTEIRVEATRSENEGGQWQISIIDQGRGIPDKSLSHLFDAGYRAPNAENVPGSGLGLAIVKQYIELHGGSISVNTRLNEGTTFQVTLPTRP